MLATVFEIAATTFGLIQGILIWLNKKENWIFYLLNIITLTVFSFISKLYGDVLENSLYIILGILGLTVWYTKTIGEKLLGKNNYIRYCTNKERVFYTCLMVAVMVVCYFWLLHTDDPMPLLDAVTTGMGITATLMMALKRVEAWVIWFVDDILMAVIYFGLPDKALYLMALNIIWIVFAVLTFISWDKASKCNNN